jgi:predicted DNA-binding transcriptional regulator AlpA
MTSLSEEPDFELGGVRDIARSLGVSERTAIRYAKLATFPKPRIKAGGKRLWSLAEVTEWYENERPRPGRPRTRRSD